MPQLPHLSEMERAYHSRDASYDGIFFLGVRTTGVFCRPSCPARKPLPRNVAYFATAEDAIAAGFRDGSEEVTGTRGSEPSQGNGFRASMPPELSFRARMRRRDNPEITVSNLADSPSLIIMIAIAGGLII